MTYNIVAMPTTDPYKLDMKPCFSVAGCNYPEMDACPFGISKLFLKFLNNLIIINYGSPHCMGGRSQFSLSCWGHLN